MWEHRRMTERTSYEVGTPSWVDLSTPDLEAALRFYGGLFGWEFEDAGEEAGHYHQALVGGKRVAGIGPAQPGGPPMAFWTTYLSGSDVDAHARAIRDAGGQLAFDPMDVMEQGRMVIASEPGGAMFGIWEPKLHTGAQLVNENATFTWNELYTRDLEASARFYGAVFGYEFDDLPEMPGGYKLVKVGDTVVAGMFRMPEEIGPDVPPYWLTYFHLDDVDAGFDRARELGGELMAEPRDSPYGRWAPVRDPQGGTFALIRSATPGS
jgi:predicted enzyme related to lactoylglutathione lyase